MISEVNGGDAYAIDVEGSRRRRYMLVTRSGKPNQPSRDVKATDTFST